MVRVFEGGDLHRDHLGKLSNGQVLTFSALDEGWIPREPLPVGSVFMTEANVNPATLLGYGEWEGIAQALLPVFLWKRTS